MARERNHVVLSSLTYPSLKISDIAQKMIALPKLLNFCGCASLKTGTMVIGALNLAVSVIGILASIVCMAGSTV